MTPSTPLADRMRPKTLAEMTGQEALLGQNGVLRKMLEQGQVPNMVLWGPPGSGKTTLARLAAQASAADFVALSAVSSGLAALREVIERAQQNQRLGSKTVLFVDEIHRWNKAQQDALLPYVEDGTLILIGATTENPSFELNNALLSRARVFVLERLEESQLLDVLKRAAENPEGLGSGQPDIEEGALPLIARLSNGDARAALNLLELCAQQGKVDEETIRATVQKTHLHYDKNGEEHYNVISALHKSLRGGDGHAGLYWLARMLEGGEDPLYIARRLLRFAAEDVGVADNFATVLAESVFEACRKIGMPECEVHLAQLVIYLAHAKKSIAAYQGYKKAKADAQKYGNLPVPLHIRNAPTTLMKDLDYGKGYRYSPLEDSSEQTYLPPELEGRKYF